MKISPQDWALKLLKKKTLTGKEVGRLLIYSYGVELKGTGTQMDGLTLNKLIEKLSPQDTEPYFLYDRLFSALIPIFYKYSDLTQSLETLLTSRSAAVREYGEQIKREQSPEPYILSRQDYERMCSTCFAHIEGEDKESFIYNKLLHIFFKKEKPTPQIQKELDLIRQQPIEGNRYRDSFTQNWYILPSGARVTNFTEEAYLTELRAWAKEHTLEETEDTDRYLDYVREKKLRLLYEGADSIKRACKSIPRELNGLKAQDWEDTLEKIVPHPDSLMYKDNRALALENALGLLPPVKKELRRELDKSLTAYDTLFIYGILHGANRGEYFKTDFPALYRALEEAAMSRDPSQVGSYFLAAYGSENLDTEVLRQIEKSGLAVRPFEEEREQEEREAQPSPLVDQVNYSLLKAVFAKLNCLQITLDEVEKDYDLDFIKEEWGLYTDLKSLPAYSLQTAELYYSLSKYYSGAELREQRKAFKERFKALPTLEEITPTEEAVTTVQSWIRNSYETHDKEGLLYVFEDKTVKTLYINIEGIEHGKY